MLVHVTRGEERPGISVHISGGKVVLSTLWKVGGDPSAVEEVVAHHDHCVVVILKGGPPPEFHCGTVEIGHFFSSGEGESASLGFLVEVGNVVGVCSDALACPLSVVDEGNIKVIIQHRLRHFRVKGNQRALFAYLPVVL